MAPQHSASQLPNRLPSGFFGSSLTPSFYRQPIGGKNIDVGPRYVLQSSTIGLTPDARRGLSARSHDKASPQCQLGVLGIVESLRHCRDPTVAHNSDAFAMGELCGWA